MKNKSICGDESLSHGISVGDQLGPYKILDVLGSGTAGTVFKAQHEATDEILALKTLTSETVTKEEVHSRFIREIAVAQKLENEHIVSYFDCGVEEGILYYTMEMVSWGSLADVLSMRRQLPWREAVECGVHLCRGLSHLHANNIVHRDLKPANIFLSDDGRLKIGDFGLARDLNAGRLTMEGMTVGTAKYLSPEQACGEEDLDGRADLYSLGCILFEMVAGRPPFKDTDGYNIVEYFEMVERHVKDPPPRLLDLVAGIPDDLDQLVAWLLAKERTARPESAAEVATDLRKILDGQAIDATKSANFLPEENDSSLTERLRDMSKPQSPITWGKLAMIAVALLAMIVLALLNR
ncbi:MAG: serine/threonine protein kinase [Rubripirellula sp.]